MAVELRREIIESYFHDPAQEFALTKATGEIRYDPLTGQLVRIFPFRNMKFHPHDWTPFVEESRRRFCPFCPEQLTKVTPLFPEGFCPEGRIRVGEAVAVPNLNPYERHTAVVVMSPQHYLSMPELTPGVIVDSFLAGLAFLKAAAAYDPDGARYGSINWNYMPYSGGSLIHPHLQVLTGPAPTTYQGELIRGANAYFNQQGSNFWTDLLSLEQTRDERYLGQTGTVTWTVTFAPRAAHDITAVLPGRRTVFDVGEKDFRDLAHGMVKIIDFYRQKNLVSFNAAIYFADRADAGFWVHARMVGRFTIFPLVGSDYSHMQVLHDDPWTLYLPEQLAQGMKPLFRED